MEQYIVALSKYFIALFMAIYTYESFSVFRFREEKQRKGIYTRQVILLFFVHFTCFLTICIKTGELKYLFFYAFQQLAVFAVLVLYELLYPTLNRLVLHNMCMLLVIGFVILTRLNMHLAIRQFFIVLASVLLAMVIPYAMRRLKNLRSYSWIYALLGIVPLGVVLALGSTTYGSKLSFSVFGISFQPSEFIKILFVFFMAGALYQSTNLLQLAYVTFVAGVHVLILVASRDLGSALIFFVTFVLMVFLATENVWYLLLGAAGGAGASVVAYQLFRHVQMRVQAWKDPWSVIDGDGYQITQSLFSLGRGGLFGLGLFQGEPGDIPKVERDFIFSAVSEEMGLIVALCVIMISLSCFIMFMNISMRLKDRFYQLVAFGMGVIYIFQVFLTIGGDTKFIPLTGVTLPLVSYGGSSVMTTVFMFAVIEGLYIIRQDEGAVHGKRKNKTAADRRKKGGAPGAGSGEDRAGQRERSGRKRRELAGTKQRERFDADHAKGAGSEPGGYPGTKRREQAGPK